MNRNKHNNRASPQPPQNIHRNTPPSQVPGLASTFGNEKGSIVALGQFLWAQGGGGTGNHSGVLVFHRPVAFQWTRSQVLKGQVCTGRMFP